MNSLQCGLRKVTILVVLSSVRLVDTDRHFNLSKLLSMWHRDECAHYDSVVHFRTRFEQILSSSGIVQLLLEIVRQNMHRKQIQSSVKETTVNVYRNCTL